MSYANGTTKKGEKHDYEGQLISETIPNGFFTVDQQWIVQSWNKGAEKLLGVPANDIIGMNLWGKFAGTIPINFYTTYHSASLKDIPANFKIFWAERETWFEVITWYYEDILSVSLKITYQPLYSEYEEQQLKVLHQLYKFVTEVTNDCLWEWDIRRREIFWIDGGHERIFGYPIVNAIIPQRFWESCLHPDDRVRVLARFDAIITEGSATIWEDGYRFKKANGEYAYVHDRGHIIYEGARPLRLIGATQDITVSRLAQLHLQEAETQLAQEKLTRQKEITHAVMTAQDKEREDIGKELHDNLNQVLGAAKLYLEMGKADGENRILCLDKSSGYILTVMDDIRRISRRLIPQVLIMGLVDSINGLLYDLLLTHPIKVNFQENGIEKANLDEKLQLAIFRIIQEQITNILKHSKATRASIKLHSQPGRIVLEIADNGLWDDASQKKEGVGIRNIISRVELYKGSIDITSKAGHGYKLKVIFPILL